MIYIFQNNILKIKTIFWLLIKLYIIINSVFSKKSKYLQEGTSFSNIFNDTIKTNTILLFEPNPFHQECTPGYTKYFIDLGYDVDVLIHVSGNDSFSLFPANDNVKLFLFNDIDEIRLNITKFSQIIKKYDFILLQSNYLMNINLYEKLGIFKLNNTFFVSHELRLFNMTCCRYLNKNRIWTLGNASIGLEVNPHYFGDFKIKEKNHIVRFFMTSSINRNYNHLVESVMQLKKENFTFEIIVTGRMPNFNSNSIPKILKEHFFFEHFASFSKLYKAIKSSDYIFIPLDPENENDIIFKHKKATGSAQLVYGFLKPAIINQEFANFYNFNLENSLIYNNSNLYNIMKKAILLKNKDYINLQKNLRVTEKKIYQASINNIKQIIDKF